MKSINDDNKKQLSILALVVFLIILAIFINKQFGIIGSDEDESLVEDGGTVDSLINYKYRSVKKINTDLFESEKYKSLREVSKGYRPEIQKGNTSPFEKEEDKEDEEDEK